MSGMDRIDPKRRREQRRRNHIVKDLRTPKYHQRRIEDKRKKWTLKDYEKEKDDDV